VLSSYWGHIWYGIAPNQRKKWYATKMLELWLIECSKIGLEKVLVCCDTNNIASAKTIEKNWGTLEKYITVEGIKNSRYWIDIK
jgi:predicted acetyltransferase